MIAKGYKDAGAQIVKLSGSVRTQHPQESGSPVEGAELNGWCHQARASDHRRIR